MIGEFSFKNFFSFKDSADFNMELASNRKKEELESNYVGVKNNKHKLLKSAVIYGPNASGKSTMLRAIFFLKMLILNSHTLKPTMLFSSLELSFPPFKLPFKPFLLDTNSRNNPTEFSISFVNQQETLYKYTIQLTDNQILSEKLVAYYSIQPTVLIDRAKQNFSFDSKYFTRAESFKEEIRENQLALSVCADKNIEEAKNIYMFFTTIHIFMDGITNSIDTLNMLNQDQTGKFKEFLLKFLTKADPSFKDIHQKKEQIQFKNLSLGEKSGIQQGFQINEETIIEKNTFQGIHQGEEDQLYPIDLNYESIGTQTIFNIAGTVFNIIDKNMILFWDEFDRSLHPELTKNIIKTIHNTKGRFQFILNTHDTSLLDIQELFRRDQIWFVDKKNYGESSLYSLAEFKEKKDKRVEKNYLKGRFGAKPTILEDNFI